jgi:hypothetical protein
MKTLRSALSCKKRQLSPLGSGSCLISYIHVIGLHNRLTCIGILTYAGPSQLPPQIIPASVCMLNAFFCLTSIKSLRLMIQFQVSPTQMIISLSKLDKSSICMPLFYLVSVKPTTSKLVSFPNLFLFDSIRYRSLVKNAIQVA